MSHASQKRPRIRVLTSRKKKRTVETTKKRPHLHSDTRTLSRPPSIENKISRLQPRRKDSTKQVAHDVRRRGGHNNVK